jgi:hypothetical protein
MGCCRHADITQVDICRDGGGFVGHYPKGSTFDFGADGGEGCRKRLSDEGGEEEGQSVDLHGVERAWDLERRN